jgi:hypothetical protein
VERSITLGGSYAEFIVWDELEAEACAVSVGELIWAGLKDPFPNCKRLRKIFFPATLSPSTMHLINSGTSSLSLARGWSEKLRTR